MLRTLGLAGLHLSEIGLTRGGEGIDLVATVTAEGVMDAVLEQAVQRLAAEPGLERVRWQAIEEG
jgi:putative Mg2+ transporter-C (MgtC) family protein